MRSAGSLALILLLAACTEPTADQGDVVANAPVEIEAVPADESAVATSGELENGVNEPDVSNLDNQL